MSRYMKHALILGCSHAAGTEMKSAVGYENSYPCLIAKKLGYSFTNKSIPGGSNDSIFRILENDLTSLINIDLVIACWTGCNRTEIWSNNTEQWHRLVPNGTENFIMDYAKHWFINHGEEKFGRLNKFKNILALNYLCLSNNIRVFNIDSFWPIDNYSFAGDIYWPTKENFWDWSINNNFKKTVGGHFDIDAHQSFANLITDSILI